MRILKRILLLVICAVILMTSSMIYNLKWIFRNRQMNNWFSHFKIIKDEPYAIKEHLDQYRKEIKKIPDYQIPPNMSTTLKSVSSRHEEYFMYIGNQSNIKTLLFHSTNNDSARAYQWTGSRSFCTEIAGYKVDVGFSGPCHEDMEHSTTTIAMPGWSTKYKVPLDRTLNGDRLPYQWLSISSFIHIIENAIVSKDGVVFTGGLHVIPISCLDTRPGEIKASKTHFAKNIQNNLNKLPRYREVFVISEYWSYGFYHAMVESVSRLFRYISFIENNREVKLHVACSAFMFSTLQILFPSRNVSDLVVCDSKPIISEIVYFPEGANIALASTQPKVSQISLELRKYIPQEAPPKNYIVLIKRTKHRVLVQHDQIASFLSDIAKENNMSFVVFADNNLPPFKDTMKLFHQARLVVAPHGAGLSNTIFSKPGLVMIEVVCNKPHINLCYRSLGLYLGHHYHGISSKSGCPAKLNVDVNEVKEAVRFYVHKIVHNILP
ncbi:unnamed protein product [Owenia fusiformis]|uniref:Uncharacterized protein n=1 Tax=Owenia fusiformis TaxID=6347 RepID=A0A8J1TWT9_OWEFU|nr:unnamed protein product [Owenia fusiformis]